MSLNLSSLASLVAGDVVAIRGTSTLQPAGGPGDKIFPPTHSVDDNNKKRAGAKYALETRRLDGADVKCVLIDSVQSQANRMEEALEALWAEGQIAIPVVSVDFTTVAPELGRVTSLSAPHRIADALLRDSLITEFEGGKEKVSLFRLSAIGKSFTDASSKNASSLFKVCPTGLLFGLWDSTGPKGGQGAKFQRAIVSEIVGINAALGSKTSSRIDPARLVNAAAILYRKKPVSGEPVTWTAVESEAERGTVGSESDVPLKLGAKRDGDRWKQGDGKITNANHSNIPPSIDVESGGVTIDEARHTVVLSLATLRRLGFTTGALEARTVLAALGLLAILASGSRGHDLRSRCLLVPKKDGAIVLEAVRSDGSTTSIDLDLSGAISLYNEAVRNLPQELRFEKGPGASIAELTPSPKLVDLIKRSRELAAAGAEVGDE